jgi:hypothetical protein
VPERTPPGFEKVTPEGKLGVHPLKDEFENVGVGMPVAVAVKVPAVLAAKVVALALVMTGSWSTVRVNF